LLVETVEIFIWRLFNQVFRDLQNRRPYKYRAKHIEITWGNVPTDALRSPDYICVESRTSDEKGSGLMSATLTDFQAENGLSGVISLRSEAPWRDSLDDTNTYRLRRAWLEARGAREHRQYVNSR
jgi:hypothetical protein